MTIVIEVSYSIEESIAMRVLIVYAKARGLWKLLYSHTVCNCLLESCGSVAVLLNFTCL